LSKTVKHNNVFFKPQEIFFYFAKSLCAHYNARVVVGNAVTCRTCPRFISWGWSSKNYNFLNEYEKGIYMKLSIGVYTKIYVYGVIFCPKIYEYGQKTYILV
jgi:hypothetical protein